MKLLILILITSCVLASCVLASCVSNKTSVSHFALEEHTFEETCAFFDSSYKATHPIIYEAELIETIESSIIKKDDPR